MSLVSIHQLSKLDLELDLASYSGAMDVEQHMKIMLVPKENPHLTLILRLSTFLSSYRPILAYGLKLVVGMDLVLLLEMIGPMVPILIQQPKHLCAVSKDRHIVHQLTILIEDLQLQENIYRSI